MLIKEPGIYEMTAEAYHADPTFTPSLSASIAKVLIEDTPRHAFTKHPRLNPHLERDEAVQFDIGNAAHSLMLGDPKRFAINTQWPTWQSNAAKEFRDQARRDGKIPLHGEQWDRVTRMVKLGRMQLEVHQDSSDAFTKGKPEQTLIWCEGKTWFRIRLDWLFDDRAKPYYDYKSTTCADPAVWRRIAESVGHDVSAAFYRRGIRALGLNKRPQMKFVVQEVDEPHALSVVEFNDEALDLADMKIDRAIARWNWCMEHDNWPAYPAYTTTIGPSPWREQDYLSRLESEAGMARSAGFESRDLLELALKWQAPMEPI